MKKFVRSVEFAVFVVILAATALPCLASGQTPDVTFVGYKGVWSASNTNDLASLPVMTVDTTKLKGTEVGIEAYSYLSDGTNIDYTSGHTIGGLVLTYRGKTVTGYSFTVLKDGINDLAVDLTDRVPGRYAIYVYDVYSGVQQTVFWAPDVFISP